MRRPRIHYHPKTPGIDRELLAAHLRILFHLEVARRRLEIMDLDVPSNWLPEDDLFEQLRRSRRELNARAEVAGGD